MCKNCQTKPVYELTNKRKFCRNCFCVHVERKVFRTIRKFNMIQDVPKKQILILQGAKSSILLHLLEKFAKVRNERITIKTAKTLTSIKSKKRIIALTDSLDDTSERIIENVMSKKRKSSSLNPVYKEKGILHTKPVYFCLDKELGLYAKIKNLPFSRNKPAKELQQMIHNFLDLMEKKHPEIKNAVVNAFIKTVTLNINQKSYN